ncbi:ParB-like chromosome segregation protein Spo0J [Nocardia tenerifensis]|uniref:ParB-like chromosome segregation protein Spo0J n=1 Tax=Nocardia tenerifensis TaxID=228006 RepID=A0A318KDW9_9NOCA|nr:ParB/RepB/Spo0J family partition protein [Nocardia tenerifensis]PXX69269.1 ParB-like chromosome segregation protein Spo0J [Nocardia tenerifensis]
MTSGGNVGSPRAGTLSVQHFTATPSYCSKIIELSIDELLPSDSPPRMAGENTNYTRILAESATALAPIVVRRATMQVVDGWHRLRAARLRGEKTIAAVFFDGGPAEAFVLAVRLNTAHGLPLSLAERKAAALRILRLYPDWSDRAVAAIVGVSPKTVSAVRKRSAVELPQSTGRIARNGVRHRADPQARQRAAEMFAADPTVSARKVAAATGISVTTAKDVRKRLRGGQSPVPLRHPASLTDSANRNDSPTPPLAQRMITAEMLHQLRKDPSLRFSETGRKVLRWLECPLDDGVDLAQVIGTIPSHCAPRVAEIARRRSQELQRMAQLLDQHTRGAFSA